ncbi:tetratricopeptide repeat protein [Geobacter sp. SVR]|uniref:tetratricopeptide repeat protein n=1 Tax=Geobacter sp. SVR TaxID=2495594 RepID=UPI00143F01F1|nr:tetratricopeptide repeat protein [Geobacter sp. SVR]BCS54004.1 hypothetical protein GSVR_23120 [Geobacter sp. SVR]GCF86215.1 hypothetical protein GSbR_28150 [Geobacter sp. SVR]
MSLFSRLFSKSTDDYLSKGDRLFESGRFFDARSVYEQGLESCGTGNRETVEQFAAKIAAANTSLAALNIEEAEAALQHGNGAKAAEHLELAKTLTNDPALREKAENLLSFIREETAISPKPEAGGGCSSCSSSSCHDAAPDSAHDHPDMSPEDYYDLLIRQLPEENYERYATLGEKFACMYLAVSQDEHHAALKMLEEWYQGSHSDIYSYEKGMILYRLGRVDDAEACLRESIGHNRDNPLPYQGLALLLIDAGRLDEAAGHLDHMAANDILPIQALMLRGEVSLLSGDSQGAIDRFAKLLTTPVAKPAAEKLYAALMQCGRQQEAARVFKQYLGGCCH